MKPKKVERLKLKENSNYSNVTNCRSLEGPSSPFYTDSVTTYKNYLKKHWI